MKIVDGKRAASKTCGEAIKNLTMAKAIDERHRYGQHYTPRDVARVLAAFAVRTSADLIFDPACGDGRLLKEAIRIKHQLALKNRSNQARRAQDVFGIERSSQAAAMAAQTGARVTAADFFDIDTSARLNGSARLPVAFDAIIGNPPYIRQEVMGARDKRRIEQRLARDCACAPEIYWPRWSGRSDIYVYFFARAIRFLKAGGRLVFLTASSWLDVGYGAALREFLLNNFRVLAVIESAAESFFADASINTSITVLEREADTPAREANLARFVQLTRPLSEILNQNSTAAAIAFAASIERANVSTTSDGLRLRVVNQAELLGGQRDNHNSVRGVVVPGWGKYLRADEVFFRVLERGGLRLRQLSEVARVRFGVKTGANEFFYVKETDDKRQQAKGDRAHDTQRVARQNAPGKMLALSEIASVRRGITTGANEFFYVKPVNQPAVKAQSLASPFVEIESAAGARHIIESNYLAPIIFSLKEIPCILLERIANAKLLFNCTASRAEMVGTRALLYIRKGERAGYHKRPSCDARELWYRVARDRKPAPLIFPSKVGERWLVAVNRARVFEDKKLYGIFPRRGVSRLLLAALLNSTWARYYAEITCRQMTGAQAIADIDVAVAEQIRIPDARELSSAIKKRLETALVAMARRPVLSIFAEAQRADRRRLDGLVLEAIGFTDRTERNTVLDELYAAVTALVRARIEKSRQS